MRGMLGLATALLLAAAPAFAQYEVVQGFDDLPPKGPGTALGIVIWNHGLSGNNDQARFPPPNYVRSLHAAGWDVVRIKRDGLSEGGGWTTGGLRHVARTVEEVQRAKAQGYARVILAGQSYGGSITLEAARRVEVYAIVPSAPGTGVSLNLVGTVQNARRPFCRFRTSLRWRAPSAARAVAKSSPNAACRFWRSTTVRRF